MAEGNSDMSARLAGYYATAEQELLDLKERVQKWLAGEPFFATNADDWRHIERSFALVKNTLDGPRGVDPEMDAWDIELQRAKPVFEDEPEIKVGEPRY